MTAAVSPQPTLRAAGFVSYRILLDGETPFLPYPYWTAKRRWASRFP